MTHLRMTTLLSAVLLLVAVAIPQPGSAQRPPIKIGFTTDLTGIAAQPAKDMVNGLQMYLDEIGGQMAGRKVELIVEDSQGTPNVALTTLRKLVEHDRVHMVAGVLFGHLGYALAPKVEEYKIPALFTVTAADDLTQRLKYRWIIRTVWASSQPSHPFGEYAARTLGHRKVVVIASDYAFAWEVVGGFQRTFEESGGQVVQKLWVPLGAMDLASYFSETNYASGRWIHEAVKAVGGKVEDRQALLAALRKVEIVDAPRGPVKLDAWGNPVQNVYIRKVERTKDGELQNTVFLAIPA